LVVIMGGGLRGYPPGNCVVRVLRFYEYSYDTTQYLARYE
jgi:hypothetical protein